MSGFLYQAFIYLTAVIISVPIAKRLGLGSVLGYIIAGVLIGPAFHLVGTETQDLRHFAEFGVVMMLFLVGLELQPRALWEMRSKLLGLGGLQVGLTTGAVMALCMLMGVVWNVSLAIGLVFSLSSTAIVLQTLNEKGLMKSVGGQSSFSVLLFQDIAVIPILALIPLLAQPELVAHLYDAHNVADGHGGTSLIEGLPGWQAAALTIGAIAFVIGAGSYLSHPLFRFIAAAKLREVFTAAALFLVVAIALLMTMVGLSPALGTFLAGVVLANSEFRHELESDIEPFKGLLLGLFFITVGAGIDFNLLFDSFSLVLGLTISLMVVKALVLLLLAVIYKIEHTNRWLFALGLAQAGEFGFVLLSFTVQSAVIPEDLAATLLLVVALSMLLTPALFVLLDRVIKPLFDREHAQEADEITTKATTIIAGLGRFGEIVNHILLANGHKTIVLDHQTDVIQGSRKVGVQSFFGDASRPNLLLSAGLREAKLLVVAIADKERAVALVEYARREAPQIHIVARAFDRDHFYRLHRAGADDIIREVFDSSVRASHCSLEALGMSDLEAKIATSFFVEEDRWGLSELADVWDEEVSSTRNPEYPTQPKANEGAEAKSKKSASKARTRRSKSQTKKLDK